MPGGDFTRKQGQYLAFIYYLSYAPLRRAV
jgi:hypothetical protein